MDDTWFAPLAEGQFREVEVARSVRVREHRARLVLHGPRRIPRRQVDQRQQRDAGLGRQLAPPRGRWSASSRARGRAPRRGTSPRARAGRRRARRRGRRRTAACRRRSRSAGRRGPRPRCRPRAPPCRLERDVLAVLQAPEQRAPRARRGARASATSNRPGRSSSTSAQPIDGTAVHGRHGVQPVAVAGHLVARLDVHRDEREREPADDRLQGAQQRARAGRPVQRERRRRAPAGRTSSGARAGRGSDRRAGASAAPPRCRTARPPTASAAAACPRRSRRAAARRRAGSGSPT